MKIELISYKNKNGKVFPYIKCVMEQVTANHCVERVYSAVVGNDGTVEWMDSLRTTYFDGVRTHNGVLKYIPEGVEERFKLLIKYEGFKEVKE